METKRRLKIKFHGGSWFVTINHIQHICHSVREIETLCYLKGIE